jgi:hypothetical protein
VDSAVVEQVWSATKINPETLKKKTRTHSASGARSTGPQRVVGGHQLGMAISTIRLGDLE